MSANGTAHYYAWDLFALGVIEGGELRAMAAHLATGCELCNEMHAEAERLVAGLAALSPEAGLPEGAELRMRQRLERGGSSPKALQRRARRGVPVPSGRSRQRPAAALAGWLAAAAMLVAAAGLAVGRHHLVLELRQQKQQAAVERARLQASLEAALHAAPVPVALQPQPAANPSEPGTDTAVSALRAQLSAAQADAEAGKLALRAALARQREAEAQLAAANERVRQLEARGRALEASLDQAKLRGNESEAGRSRAEQDLAQARQQLDRAEAERGRLAAVSHEDARMAALLESSTIFQLPLKAVGGVKASARVFWRDDRGLLLVARDLPPPPEHESYELWFYRHGQSAPVPVGALRVDSAGNALLYAPPSEALQAMTGALVTRQSGPDASVPGVAVLRAR